MAREWSTEQRVERYMDRLYEDDPEYTHEVRAWVSFLHYLSDIMSTYGLGYDGFVCRQRHSQVTLTVKGNEGGTPLVAFTSGATTSSCMQMFLRALQANKVRWIRDKYPWT